MSFAPREYQAKAIAAARASVIAGRRRVLLVSPTGSGKTFIGCLIVAGSVRRKHRAAWFAHRVELRDQAVASLERIGLEVGHSGLGSSRPVQVVSTQGSLSCEEVPDAELVVIDEAHHYAADEWGRLLAAYPKAIIIGLTATPERGDSRGLGHMFDELHVVAQPKELVKLWESDNTQGLVPCEVIAPRRVQSPGELCQPPVEAYQEHARGRRNVVFASNVREACDFAAAFKSAGISAHIVHGELAADIRERNLRDFAAGRVKVIVNVFVLTEGWDCPATDCVTVARKMGSCSMFLQAAGRGARPSPGKSSWMLLDLAGITHLHGHPFDDRVYSLEGPGIMLAGDKGPRFCRSCGEELREPGPCPDCGGVQRSRVKPVRFSGDPLERFGKYQVDTEAERIARLAKWIRVLEADGKSWKSALYKYKTTYAGYAPKKIVSHALRAARSKTDDVARVATP